MVLGFRVEEYRFQNENWKLEEGIPIESQSGG